MKINLYNDDCLEKLKDLPDNSIDLTIADLPYGSTNCKWDTQIPFEPLWTELYRVNKDTSPMVFFCSQPFTSVLITSNLKHYKYNWVWEKENGTGALISRLMPMKKHEDIAVFYRKQPAYDYNDYTQKAEIRKQSRAEVEAYAEKYGKEHSDHSSQMVLAWMNRNNKDEFVYNSEYKKKTSILKFTRDTSRGKKHSFHPTQKPVALIEYLIETYTKEGDTILDPTMGSGTTGIAAFNTNREFIGIELDKNYYDVAVNRINRHKSEPKNVLFKKSLN